MAKPDAELFVGSKPSWVKEFPGAEQKQAMP